MDRIVTADLTDEKADRPDDFDLAQEWDHVVDVVEQHRSTTEASVLIAARLLPVLQDHFGRHLRVDEPAQNHADDNIHPPEIPPRHRSSPPAGGRRPGPGLSLGA